MITPTIPPSSSNCFLVLYFSFYPHRYGDKTARGFWARIVAILWTMVGLVVNGILIGALSTAVTIASVDETTTLYGSTVSETEYVSISGLAFITFSHNLMFVSWCLS